VVIKGTITDISPGVNDARLKLRFPNGIAAVSDESQSGYMLYVYKQFEMPTNTTGVPVMVSVIDENGNYREIGTTTSDSTGYYSLSWTPDIAGKYNVYVTFAGSKAYYGSVATNSFVVDEASAQSTPQATQAPSVADQYFLPATIVIVVLIVIVLAMLVLMMMKKP
jgi:hypothetical protein